MLPLHAGFRVERDYMRPLARRIHQSAHNRISANVFPLFREMLFVSNTGIEEILLELYFVSRRQIRFPMSDHIRQRYVRRHVNQHMDMVWHYQKQMQHPLAGRLIESRRVQDCRCLVRQHRRTAFSRSNRDEIHRLGHVYRDRSAMIHRLARRPLSFVSNFIIHDEQSYQNPFRADRPECDPYRKRRRQQASSFARRTSAEETADEMRRA